MEFIQVHSRTHQRFGLITVVSLIFMIAMLSASIIGYSVFERRMSERSRLALRAGKRQENISLYAAEQLIVKLQGMEHTRGGPLSLGAVQALNTMIVYMPPASATAPTMCWFPNTTHQPQPPPDGESCRRSKQ